jgi:hypothetical protein
VETIMETGAYGVTFDSYQVVFAGQNWSLREIWFYDFVPTHITNDTYTIRAYTLGYVPQFVDGITAFNQLVGFGQADVNLFIGNELDITVPVFASPESFTNTPEYDHAIGQVFSGTLAGAEMTNLSAGTPTLSFTIFGFGGMLLNSGGLVGQGHFFYVSPDGTRFFDFGLDEGNYTAALPEFGFTVHFLQVATQPVVQFNDLFLEIGTFLKVYEMARIVEGAPVTGYTDPPFDIAPLSWAQVQASNGTYTRSISTFDGLYEGVGALELPAGIYNITFTDVQYNSYSVINFQVQWANVYSVTPPILLP